MNTWLNKISHQIKVSFFSSQITELIAAAWKAKQFVILYKSRLIIDEEKNKNRDFS